MTAFLAYTVIGIATGCIYALTASGLVVTYTTSGIFNFAHGAIGMLMAFTYWQLTVQWGWPQWLALIAVLGVIAPALGALIQRTLMRRLYGASTSTTLVITLGLLLSCIGVATILWDPGQPRSLPEFFTGHSVKVFSIFVTYHQLTMISVAVLVAVFLRLFLFRTRIGTAMRAVVDDPELASLNGAAPDRVAAASWALGASLAGLAGILLAPLVSLDIILLTLLVINGYAAAMVGRLRSLPWTFAGGIALGLAEAHTIGNLPSNILNIVKPALPIIFLYVVLLILPQARLRVGRIVTTQRPPRVASLRESLVAGAGFVAVAAILSAVLSPDDLFTAGQGVVFALIMLSLVLLTGYGGQVSLAQMTFVGIGAFAMGKFFGGGSVLGIVAATVLAGAAGAVAALPAIRLQGLYLALSTLAFAQGMSQIFFKNQNVFGYGGRLVVKRPSILGLSFAGDRAFFILVCITFAACGIGVLALRRGSFGRRLIAMRESPAACATLGLNLTATKLAVFTLSSAMAGLAGAFYGGLRGQVGLNDFEMLQSLVLLLLVSVAGINTVTGALMGGLTFGLFPKIQRSLPSIPSLSFLGAGFGAIALGRNPNGWTSEVGPRIAQLRSRALPATPLRQRILRNSRSCPVLKAEMVDVKFGVTFALYEATVEAAEGQVTGLIGPNGAGKTTLFNVVTGLQVPTRGRVSIDGEDVTGVKPHMRSRRRVGRTFQRLEVFGSLTARENILVGAEIRNRWDSTTEDPRAVADEILDRVGLSHVGDEPVDSMPTGLARLVELGRALAIRPKLLLLDEPGSGLDTAETLGLGELLTELARDGMAILLVEHDVELVMRISKEIYVLDFGRVIAHGTPKQVQNNTEVQNAYLGVEVPA